MVTLRIGMAAFGAALLAAALAPAAKADEYNKKTDVTFSEPVEIPGMVLPAGKYVFKLADSQADRNIVQIFNADETHVYATILAVPDYRLQPTGKTVITFEERAAGAPQAIQAWFYPGDNYGDEFVYPKHKAVELAKANQGTHVLSMPNEQEKNITKPVKSMNEPAVLAMKKAPIKAERPKGMEVEEVEIAQVHAPVLAQNPAGRLPQTASLLPLVALLGLLSLGMAAGLRVVSKRAV